MKGLVVPSSCQHLNALFKSLINTTSVSGNGISYPNSNSSWLLHESVKVYVNYSTVATVMSRAAKVKMLADMIAVKSKTCLSNLFEVWADCCRTAGVLSHPTCESIFLKLLPCRLPSNWSAADLANRRLLNGCLLERIIVISRSCCFGDLKPSF